MPTRVSPISMRLNGQSQRIRPGRERAARPAGAGSMALPGIMRYLVASRFSSVTGSVATRSAHRHEALGVRGASGGAEQHRGVEALGELVGGDHEFLGLAAVGRFQQRDPGELGVVAVVLLVLRAVHAGVVRRDDHDTALQTHVGRGEERVGGHVQAHVLHADQCPAACHRGPDAHFHGHLLVGRPLAVDVVVVGERLEDLGAGRARIGRGQLDPRLPGSARDSLVA